MDRKSNSISNELAESVLKILDKLRLISHTKDNFMKDTPKFVVGVIGIIRKADNILLMRRALTKSTNPGKWEAIAGKVEFKEHPNDALHREIKEESGLNVSINERPLTSFQTMRGTEPMILIYYLCDYVSGDVALSKEHDAYKWANFQEFKTLCSFNELIEIVDYIFVK
jgi:8-oxo-dGTP diphosphatase